MTAASLGDGQIRSWPRISYSFPISKRGLNSSAPLLSHYDLSPRVAEIKIPREGRLQTHTIGSRLVWY